MRTLLYCLAFPTAAALALGVVMIVNALEKRRNRLRPDQVPYDPARWEQITPRELADRIARGEIDAERLRVGEGPRWLN